MAREKLNTFPPSANHVGFELNVRRNNMSWSIGISYSIWYLLFFDWYLLTRARRSKSQTQKNINDLETVKYVVFVACESFFLSSFAAQCVSGDFWFPYYRERRYVPYYSRTIGFREHTYSGMNVCRVGTIPPSKTGNRVSTSVSFRT